MSPGNTTKQPEDHIMVASRILQDGKQDLAKRFRALFTLRNADTTDDAAVNQAINAITSVLLQDPCPLLKHECAFCLGQMQNASADSALKRVLAKMDEHAMVRHEAGEALAAIGSRDSLEILKHYSSDPVLTVAQTCQLGVEKMMKQVTNGDQKDDSMNSSEEKTKGRKNQVLVFDSIDPTPAAVCSDIESMDQLVTRLNDQTKSLYERYEALFGLRNLATNDAAQQLGKSLVNYCCDGSNALLAHEIAYVLGQLRNEVTIPFLKHVVDDSKVDEMVRHEAAEALGAIASPDAFQYLKDHHDHHCDDSTDPSHVVRRSIQVALDMSDYENNGKQFNFLDTTSSNNNIIINNENSKCNG